MKKFGASNNRSHVKWPLNISSVIASPLFNSRTMTVSFDLATLNVEFCCG